MGLVHHIIDRLNPTFTPCFYKKCKAWRKSEYCTVKNISFPCAVYLHLTLHAIRHSLHEATTIQSFIYFTPFIFFRPNCLILNHHIFCNLIKPAPFCQRKLYLYTALACPMGLIPHLAQLIGWSEQLKTYHNPDPLRTATTKRIICPHLYIYVFPPLLPARKYIL